MSETAVAEVGSINGWLAFGIGRWNTSKIREATRVL